ncbi:EMILIN-3 [Aplochiton taeniatus]
MPFLVALSTLVVLTLSVSLVGAKGVYYRSHQFNKAGSNPHHAQGNPASRHKNHCAYVVEKTVSYAMQEGSAPFVKAEYNKCSWGQKCPSLVYRLMYKPIYKVGQKTLTELEWRCCPGYSGYGCMEGPPAYHHPMRAMPPFKGQQHKGPQFKRPPSKGPEHHSPLFKGPIVKGPQHHNPQFKGPPFNGPQNHGSEFKGPSLKGPQHKGPPMHPGMKAHPWSQHKGPPTNTKTYPMRHFGPPRTLPYPQTSFEPYPSEPEPMPDHQEQPGLMHHPEGGEQEEMDHEHEPALEETAPSPGNDEIEGEPLDSETEERLERMEEDVRRLNQGLETLRGTIDGLEDGLRASLREDANRMLSALLSTTPGPIPAPATAFSSHLAVGFGDIPGGDPEGEGLDGKHVFPGLGDLTGRVEELRVELQAKAAELEELRGAVMGHDGALKRLSVGDPAGLTGAQDRHTQKATEVLIEAKLGSARTEILGGFEKRVVNAEGRCEEQAGEVRRQCQKEQEERQDQLEQTLEGSATGLRRELGNLEAQIHNLNPTEGSGSRLTSLAERVHLLEQSMAGLNQSQSHLRVEMGGHKDHVEGLLEGRLGYVEALLNLTGKEKVGEAGGSARRSLEARLEGKLKALEGRLMTAVEELGNGTAPTALEGHVVPTLETEFETLRGRLEMDLERVQKQMSILELTCTSASSSSPSGLQGDAAGTEHNAMEQEEEKVNDLLDVQAGRLNSLNATLQSLLDRLSGREHHNRDHAEDGTFVQGELLVLKFNVHSVNRTLKGLQESVGTVMQQVGQANSTWQEREERLAQQMKGVVQLVGRQASMLGAGERRLSRVKSDLQELRRRLAGEVQGCRTTTQGVQREVTEVGGRVASVEGQCKGLSRLADDLETIREELERHSDGLLSRVNGTLSSHAHQLSELRNELRNCTAKLEPTQQSVETKPQHRGRGDTFTLI